MLASEWVEQQKTLTEAEAHALIDLRKSCAWSIDGANVVCSKIATTQEECSKLRRGDFSSCQHSELHECIYYLHKDAEVDDDGNVIPENPV